MPENEPTIVIPYLGPDASGRTTDVFLYLRPESNGVEVEHSLFRVVHDVPRYRSAVKLVYLVNLPGSFLQRMNVVRNHYRVREYFARRGKAGLTQGMRNHFRVYFGLDPDKSEILGAYEAMERLGLDEKALFDIWVEPYDILITCGQIIKKYRNSFIINYDIPYLLRQQLKDIAAMIFRFRLSPEEIHGCLEEMRQSLVLDNVLDPLQPPARVFHYSKSPFDLLQDSEGHLIGAGEQPLGWRSSSFGVFLREHGLSEQEIERVMRNPILEFEVPNVGRIEEHINIATTDFSYEEALNKYRTHVGQILLEES